jgi:isoquinoline 1-oxidoreductase beta subunit
VTFTAGKANVTNFSNYRVLRLQEMPAVTVQVVPSSGPIGGIGETGVPCVAPAIANAYAKLTGTRLRTLPFYPGATMGEI